MADTSNSLIAHRRARVQHEQAAAAAATETSAQMRRRSEIIIMKVKSISARPFRARKASLNAHNTLKLVLATILIGLVQQQVCAAFQTTTHHHHHHHKQVQNLSNNPRAHRKRDSAAPTPPPAASPASREDEILSQRQFTIPANQRQIIQMLPSDGEGRGNSLNDTAGTGAQSSSSSSPSQPASSPIDCTNGLLTFELSTGFIYKPAGSGDTLAMMPSTLQLTDCLNYCLTNSSCLAINFEMGLCVLLATSANENPQNLYSSQFPVFTIYAEKKCLLSEAGQQAKGRHKCERAWTFERVAGFEMKMRPKRRLKLATRELCMDACLGEQEFECRSANWYRDTGECHLNDQDRHSVSQLEAGNQQVKASLGDFYGPATGSGSGAPNETRMAAAPPPPPAAFANLYDNYRQSPSTTTLISQNGSVAQQAPVTAAPSASNQPQAGDSSLASKLTTGWASGKRHFKQLFLGVASAAPPSRKRQHKPAAPAPFRARQLGADWSTAGAPSTFEGHYIDVPASTHVDYLENNCIYEPNKLCEFRKIQNRVLKTVDSIYQDISSLEECKQKCLNAPYRCYSFDYGDTSERVCRTSHLDQASLLSVSEPYLEVVGAITYELATCYNVSIQCKAREMLVQVSSSKSFNGKIYAKSRPATCATDVTESLHFELAMKYHDQEAVGGRACDVRASSNQLQGIFSNDIVIQHHDRIMTTQDVGLSVFCRYDLGNRSVTNNIDLNIEPLGEGPVESKQSAAQGSHSTNKSPLTITGLATTVVRSPNVTMRITNMNGQPVSSATVGDRLALLFEVKEKTSPFGIFVREIVAMDGRQYLQHQHQLHQQQHHHQHHQHGHHPLHANSSSQAHQQLSHEPSGAFSHREGDSDKSTPPSSGLFYGSPPSPSSTPHNGHTHNASHAPHGSLNDTLIEAMFQIDSVNSIQFIDSDGCPTDANLMGPLVKMDPHGHRLLAPFDAFKFPTSDMVFFRAVVTSCLAECKPAVCPNYSPSGVTAAVTQVTSTTPSALYSSTLAQAGSNSILADEAPGELKGATPGIAQLLTFNGDK